MLSKALITCLLLLPVASATAVEAQVQPATTQSTSPPIQPGEVKNTATTELRDYIAPNSAPAQPGSVESFFQIPSDTKVQPATSTSKTLESSRQPVRHSLFRGAWHILDNLGIPMFYGPDNTDLDPSIPSSFKMPPLKFPRDKELDKRTSASDAELKPPASVGTASTTSAPPANREEKIPQSELEGTIYDSGARNDAQTTPSK